jgi:hypothetical protein
MTQEVGRMRIRNFLITATVVSALAMAGTFVGASPAAAGTGGACPDSSSSFIRWDVSTQPYQADNASDSNGDGWVCARATKDTFVENGQTYVVYLFIDDNTPVRG